MPLIRYRTGDLSRFIPGECPCGTVLKTLARVKSRANSYVKVGVGYLRMADLDEAIFPITGVCNFSAALIHEGKKDCLQLEVVLAEGIDDDPAPAIQKALETIPAVYTAQQSGRLVVQLLTQTGNSVGPSSLAKRMIMNR
jgi:phenylacetate-coenzyme A ligase PaaK-like adenylate-forming protein